MLFCLYHSLPDDNLIDTLPDSGKGILQFGITAEFQEFGKQFDR